MALSLRAALREREPLGARAALVRAPTPNVTRQAAAANPQASPTRASLVPGSAPLVASALTPPREVVASPLVTPREPSMSLLGRIGGAIKGAVGGFVAGGPAGAIGGAALGAISSGGARRPNVGTRAIVGTLPSALPALVGQTTCPPGSFKGPFGCMDLMPGGAGSGSGIVVSPGDPRRTRGGPMEMGGYAPARTTLEVRRCGKGAVLGFDGLCYDKRMLRKDQRAWVPGRKPLLTGGDLNAIAKAARAARRMKGQQRKLERLGLLKRPTRHAGSSRGVITKAEAARALRS